MIEWAWIALAAFVTWLLVAALLVRVLGAYFRGQRMLGAPEDDAERRDEQKKQKEPAPRGRTITRRDPEVVVHPNGKDE